MKSYLESMAAKSNVYKSAESFAKKNRFKSIDITENAFSYKLKWKDSKDIGLFYELMPFSMENPFPGEFINLETDTRQTELVFPKDLKQDALYIRTISLHSEKDMNHFFRYRNSNNYYLKDLYNTLKTTDHEGTQYSSLLKTNFNYSFNYLHESLKYYHHLKEKIKL